MEKKKCELLPHIRHKKELVAAVYSMRILSVNKGEYLMTLYWEKVSWTGDEKHEP